MYLINEILRNVWDHSFFIDKVIRASLRWNSSSDPNDSSISSSSPLLSLMTELPGGSTACDSVHEGHLNSRLKKNHFSWMEGKKQEALEV